MSYTLRQLIDIVALAERAEPIKTAVDKLYHVTAKSNVESILKTGIEPRAGSYGDKISYDDAVFLSDNYKELIRDMSTLLHTWGDDKVALVVDVKGLTLYHDENIFGNFDSVFTVDHIDAKRVLSIIDPKTGKTVPASELVNNMQVLNKDEQRSDQFYVLAYTGTPELILEFKILDPHRGKDSAWRVKLVDSRELDDGDGEEEAELNDMLDKFNTPAKAATQEIVLAEFERFMEQQGLSVDFAKIGNTRNSVNF